MQKDSYNNIIVQILISPSFRIVRHLILVMCILAISAGNIGHAMEQGVTLSLINYGGLFFSTVVVLGGCYLNIYILTPKLLLRGEWGWHFISLLGIAFLLFLTFLISALMGGAAFVEADGAGYFIIFKGITNLLSSILALFVLLAGTSTIVLFKNWILDMKQSEELESVTLQQELKLLENQINPHFLFNMLNNANIMIKKEPDVAVHIIGKLEEMLRYLMNDNIDEKVYLKEEILFLNDFLELEKTRRDYFTYSISENGNIDNIQIVPLLFIAFVENAVKHSQDSQNASYVHILFNIAKDNLIFICENSLPSKMTNKQVGGIGLTNIKRRLDLLFQHNYSLDHTKTETKYIVKLELRL